MADSSESGWRAGVAAVDITPAEPIWLHGWGARDHESEGIQQRIFAKALALEDPEGHRVLWVTADLLGFSRDMADALAAAAGERHGIGRADFMLNASHNHCGPCAGDILPLYFDLPQDKQAVIDRYTEEMMQRVVQAMDEAVAGFERVRLTFGQGVAGFGVNRRRVRPDSRSLPTVVDQDVPVLAAWGGDGGLRAVTFGYACHATACIGYKINGDYPGYAQEALEKTYPGAVALFVTGCGGDINPLPRHRSNLGELYGEVLAAAVGDVLDDDMPAVGDRLRTAHAVVDLPLSEPPTRAELQALLPDSDAAGRRYVENLLDLIDRDGALAASVPCSVQVWSFGETPSIIALPAEPVVDYSLRFKAQYGWENTWVAGYTHEFISYIPSKRVLSEGGYEGDTGMMECGLPGPYAAAVEEIIADQVAGQMRQKDS
jgi:hypothetical protein